MYPGNTPVLPKDLTFQEKTTFAKANVLLDKSLLVYPNYLPLRPLHNQPNFDGSGRRGDKNRNDASKCASMAVTLWMLGGDILSNSPSVTPFDFRWLFALVKRQFQIHMVPMLSPENIWSPKKISMVDDHKRKKYHMIWV